MERQFGRDAVHLLYFLRFGGLLHHFEQCQMKRPSQASVASVGCFRI